MIKKPQQVKPAQQTALFKLLRPNVRLPVRVHESAAYDIYAHELTETNRPNRIVVPAHACSRPIGTGLAVTPPPGYAALICSRSGLAGKGLFVANSPGVIDPDYTGEIRVLLYNGSYQTAHVLHDERLAQLLFVPFINPEFKVVDDLPDSFRGQAGFGSSGLGEL